MANWFKYYYMLFAESYVAILVFTIFFLLLMVEIFMPYQSYLLDATITNQVAAYNLPQIAAADEYAAGLDVLNLKKQNDLMHAAYAQEQSQTNSNNQAHNITLAYILSGITGTLLVLLIIPILAGYIKLGDLPWRQFIFAFILHAIFIVSLEAFLLLCVIKPYTSLKLYTMFNIHGNATCANQLATEDPAIHASTLLALKQYLVDHSPSPSHS